MTPSPWLGALVGLTCAVGLLLVAERLPARRRPTLAQRVAPYLRTPGGPSRLLARETTLTPFPTLERLFGPIVVRAARRVEDVLGGTASVRRRLERAGSTTDADQFRAEQVIWGAAAFAGCLAPALLLLASGRGSPVALLVLCAIGGVVGVLARDWWLSQQVARREARLMAELPTVAELLALAVAAGEGPAGALERVVRLSTGDLSAELGRALADSRSGTSLVVALDHVSRRTGLPALARFVDGIAVAVERGTPLADVLHAQAADVREAGRRELIEVAARKEVLMMMPVVFLVLPVTVLFAFWPGVLGLSLTAP